MTLEGPECFDNNKSNSNFGLTGDNQKGTNSKKTLNRSLMEDASFTASTLLETTSVVSVKTSSALKPMLPVAQKSKRIAKASKPTTKGPAKKRVGKQKLKQFNDTNVLTHFASEKSKNSSYPRIQQSKRNAKPRV